MFYYVEVARLATLQWIELFIKLSQSGYTDVHYDNGGWIEYEVKYVMPHLRFENEEDAMAYKLSHGGKVRTTKPYRTTLVS